MGATIQGGGVKPTYVRATGSPLHTVNAGNGERPGSSSSEDLSKNDKTLQELPLAEKREFPSIKIDNPYVKNIIDSMKTAYKADSEHDDGNVGYKGDREHNGGKV